MKEQSEYFVKVPVETLPEKSGTYFVVDDFGYMERLHFNGEKFRDNIATHWLKPISSEELLREKQEYAKAFGTFLMQASNRVIKKSTKMVPLDSETGPKLINDLFDLFNQSQFKKEQ